MTRLLFCLIWILLLCGGLCAQTDPTPPKFSIGVSVAAASPSPRYWYFTSGHAGGYTGWGRSESVEIAYGPLITAGGMDINSFAAISYAHVDLEATVVDFAVGQTARASWQRIPVLLGVRFSTPSRFTPFLEVAAGVMYVRFAEEYSRVQARPPASLSYWAVANVLGTGLEFKISPKAKVFVFLRDLNSDGSGLRSTDRGGLEGSFTTTGDFLRGIGAMMTL